MTNSDRAVARAIADAAALPNDLTFQRDVAQVRARAALEELPGEPEAPHWTYSEGQLVRNSTAASIALSRAAMNGGIGELLSESLTVARLWEAIGKLKEGTARKTAIANAAAAYELAGYQANAACLAKGLGDPNRVTPNLDDLAAAFLRRYFIAVRNLGSALSLEPTADQLRALVDADGTDIEAEVIRRAALATTGRGLATVGRYFLSGDRESLDEGAQVLHTAEQAFVEVGLPYEANLVSSLRSLLAVMASRSTWSQLHGIADEAPGWRRYLTLLARGIGPDPYAAPSISELWPSQIQALQRGLLSDNDSKVVRLPTSAGKTRIAEMAIVKTLLSDPDARCIYVAPYRALVTEVERGLFGLFADLGIPVTSVLGSYDSDDLEASLAGESRVLVVTPEKLDLLSRLDADLVDRTRLLVLDEGHVVGDPNRGARLDLMISRFRQINPHLRVLMLSAVVSDETLRDFARWFNASDDDVVELQWRPAVQRIAMLDWRGERATLRYAREGESGILPEFVPGIAERRRYPYRHPETGRWRRPVFPGNTKADLAADAAYRFAELGPVLVFCWQTNFVRAVAKALETRLDLAGFTDDPPAAYFETAETRAAQAATEWLGNDHEVTGFLRRGIAVHHGQMADVIRQAVELDFRQRRYRILVATNTLAQGVNLPIRTVIVHSVRRHDGQQSHRLPPRDYWNIAGRAGRAGEETEGSLIHLVTNRTDLMDYEHFLGAAREPAVDSALFTALKYLVAGRISEEALANGLDSEILALLVEEAGPDGVADLVGGVLDGTLAATQAAHREVDLEPLRRVITRRAIRITEEVEDPSLLPLYSSTGLRAASCERIREAVVESAEDVQAYLTAPQETPSEVARFCLATCEEIDELQPSSAFAGNYGELLSSWVAGTSIEELRKVFGEDAGGPDALSELVDKYFGYLLPWGANSVVRIAQRVLGIQREDLTPTAQFLPTMIKHGLPVAAASWAVTAGVPSRALAMDIAAAYLTEARIFSYGEFMSWLAAIAPDDFRERFGVSGYLVDDLAAALDRSAYNPMITEYPDARDALPLSIRLSGGGRPERLALAADLGVGAEVMLAREYGDPISRNAVAVRSDGQLLGYMPRREAQLLAPELDVGTRMRATLEAVDSSNRRSVVRITLV